MPYKPKHPCWHPGCPNLTDKAYCPEHAKAEAKRYNHQERDPDSNKRYGRQWKEVRAAFLSLYPLCEMCENAGKLVPATMVHHKHRLADGGTNEFSNLMALCQSCHSRLHSIEGDRWRD